MAILKDFREYLAEKLNPAQPAIATDEGTAGPDNIVDWKTAYSEIEIVHRSVEIIINACVKIPYLIKSGP